MKKQTFTLIALMAVMAISMVSCTYKGECKCGGVTVEDEYDSKEDYDDAKETCEDLGCEWKKVL